MKIVWLLILVLAAGVGYGAFTVFESVPPVIHTRTQPVYVGQEHVHEFRLMDEGMGIEHARVWLETAGGELELYAETYDGDLFRGATLTLTRPIEVKIEPKAMGLVGGNATLHASAKDYSWSGNETHVEVPLVIDAKAPRISLKTGLTYVRRGGTEAVVYGVDEEVEHHGVELGESFFPGFPHPNDPDRFVAFYAIPPGTNGVAPKVVAKDRAGNRSTSGVTVSLVEKGFPEDKINLSDSFMQAKVGEILGGERTDTLEAYLEINNGMRKENAEQIRKLCESSSPERLWSGAFVQLPNSNVGGRFAEKREYMYNGKVVDRQTHLGYDLASTGHAEIPAANDGVVVFAEELGIYGQAVIIDHGLSLFSLYGHLSEIQVEKGQAVAKNETIGLTGNTGLAGGDHLHFGMLVGGTFVDPLEWFDPKWIAEHIEVKLVVAETEAGEAAAAPAD